MMKNKVLTANRVRELLIYTPETGEFIWRIDRRKMKPGDPAGCIHRGRLLIKCDDRMYRASRLAWLYMTGDWPQNEIDHKDCDTLNDKWENLRAATRCQNSCNRRRRENPKGIRQTPTGKWWAQITFLRRSRHIGTYETAKEAHAAYCAAASKYFGEFARHE